MISKIEWRRNTTMPSQMIGVTGNRRLRRDQLSELNARLGMLPTMLSQQQQKEQLAQEYNFRERELKQGKQQADKMAAFQKSQAQREMGLEIGKLGVNVSTSPYLKKTVGEMTTSPMPPKGRSVSEIQQGQPTSGGYFANLSPNAVLSGGLAGFGIGNMFNKKSKLSKSLLGMGAGALTGMISGGTSGGMQGGFAGLIGGLFS